MKTRQRIEHIETRCNRLKHALTGMMVLALSLCSPLRAEEKYFGDVTVSLKVDRSDGMYTQGEECSFTLLITQKGSPVPGVELDWTVSKDGVAPFVRGTAKTDEKGKAFFKGNLCEPGFVRCTCLFRLPGNEREHNIQAGAAYDPLLIKPSMPAPDDFSDYWDRQKELLAEVPMNLVLTPVKSTDDGVLLFDVQADSLVGKLSGYLAYPKGAKPGTLPAIVTCHGAGVRSSYGNRSGPNSHRAWSPGKWAARGFIALDFNALGIPNGKPRSFYTHLQETTLKSYALRGTESRDKLFFRELYLRLMRAMDVIVLQPQWDKKILVVAGRSQGGGQAIAAAGLNNKVTFLVAHIPAMCDMTGMLTGRANGWPRDLGAKRLSPQEKGQFLKGLEGNDTFGVDKNGVDAQNKVWWDRNAIENSRYIDAVNFAGIVRCDAFFSVGFCDKICPPTTVFAAYNSIASTNKEILHRVDYGHISCTKADAAAEAAVTRHVQKMRAGDCNLQHGADGQ